MNTERLFTKDFLLGTFFNFFLLFDYYLLMVVITIFSMDILHASYGIAGLTSSIFIVSALVARFFSGRYMESIGRKRLMLMGATLEFIMSLSYFLIGGLPSLFFIRIMHGISYGMASTAISTIVTSLVPRTRQGEGISYYMLSVTMGSAVGPLLGLFLIKNHTLGSILPKSILPYCNTTQLYALLDSLLSKIDNFQLIFATCTLIIIAAFICCLLIKVPEIQENKKTEETVSKGFDINNFFEVRSIPISFVCTLVFFCYSSLLSFLAPYAKSIELHEAAGFFFTVYSLVIFFSRPLTGKLLDKKGELITMYPAFISFIIGLIVLSQAHCGASILIAGGLLGFGVGTIQSCGLAIAVQGIPINRFGLVNSTYYIFLDIGVGIGPLVLGSVVGMIGYRGMYLSLCLVTLIDMVIYYIIWRKKDNKKRLSHNEKLD